MSKRTQHNIALLIMLGVFIAFLVAAMTYGRRVRLVPVPVAIFSIIATLCQLYVFNFRPDLNFEVDAEDIFVKGEAGKDKKVGRKGSRTFQKELEAFGVLTALLVLMYVFGILPAILLYVFGYYVFITKLKWHISALYSVGTALFVYVIFVFILNVRLYGGLIDFVF